MSCFRLFAPGATAVGGADSVVGAAAAFESTLVAVASNSVCRFNRFRFGDSSISGVAVTATVVSVVAAAATDAAWSSIFVSPIAQTAGGAGAGGGGGGACAAAGFVSRLRLEFPFASLLLVSAPPEPAAAAAAAAAADFLPFSFGAFFGLI